MISIKKIAKKNEVENINMDMVVNIVRTTTVLLVGKVLFQCPKMTVLNLLYLLIVKPLVSVQRIVTVLLQRLRNDRTYRLINFKLTIVVHPLLHFRNSKYNSKTKPQGVNARLLTF